MPNWCWNIAKVTGTKDQINTLSNAKDALIYTLKSEAPPEIGASRHMLDPTFHPEHDGELVIDFDSAWDASNAISAFQSALESGLIDHATLYYVEAGNQLLGMFDSDLGQMDFPWPETQTALDKLAVMGLDARVIEYLTAYMEEDRE